MLTGGPAKSQQKYHHGERSPRDAGLRQEAAQGLQLPDLRHQDPGWLRHPVQPDQRIRKFSQSSQTKVTAIDATILIKHSMLEVRFWLSNVRSQLAHLE